MQTYKLTKQICPESKLDERNIKIEKLKHHLRKNTKVVGLDVYLRDCVVVRQCLGAHTGGGERGEIKAWSPASRKRLALLANNSGNAWRTMVTLTYPAAYSTNGAQVKQDLDAILKRLSRKFNNPPYLWILEFQKRGAPHFHVWLDATFEVDKVINRKGGKAQMQTNAALLAWLSDAWFHIVGSGDARHLRAGASIERMLNLDGCARYITKEAAKRCQKFVPRAFHDVGRFWGKSRNTKAPKPINRVQLSERQIKGIYPDAIHPLLEIPFSHIWGGAKAMAHMARLDKLEAQRRKDKQEKTLTRKKT